MVTYCLYTFRDMYPIGKRERAELYPLIRFHLARISTIQIDGPKEQFYLLIYFYKIT